MKTAIIFAIIFLCSQKNFALNPRDPLTLCDRFITVEEQKICEEKIRKIQPDWYLSGVCQHQYEDQNFYDCLILSRQKSFHISKLHQCEDSDLNDEERMECLNKIALKDDKKSQRQPASKKKPNSLPRK